MSHLARATYFLNARHLLIFILYNLYHLIGAQLSEKRAVTFLVTQVKKMKVSEAKQLA